MRHPTPIEPLPERRQTLAVALIAILGYAPLGRYFSWKITAFLSAIICLRLIALRWPAATPGRYALLALTAAGGLVWLHTYQGIPGKTAGAALFAIMLGLKLLELRARRDHRVVAILHGFLAVVVLLFDQSIAIACYLAVLVLGAVAILVDLNGGLGDNGWRRSLRLAGRISLEAVPIALALFVLFPRLGAPLWNLGVEKETGTVGMSDRLEPGAVSELVIDGELAFRVRFDRAPPATERLYWRGLVLWAPGETGWSPGIDPDSIKDGSPMIEAGDWIDYEVILEPSRRRWMFALDLPTNRPQGSTLSQDFQLRADRPIDSPKRYRLRSVLTYRTPETSETLKRYALRLPANVTPRMRTLADRWRQGATNDWDVVQAGLAHFHRESFFYTLLPPRLGANPMDEFLFETRSGFCEHYASSFALLMRIAGIPSRIVLGYLGGEQNRIGGYTMVWQSDAHAWVEVLIEGRGWVRVDPTSAVAAERIDNRSATQLLQSGTSVRFELGSDSLFVQALRQARNLADSLNAAWQYWVLDFDVDQQRSMLDWIGLRAYGETALILLMTGTLGLILALTLAALVRRDDRSDPVQRSYELFCRRLARVGIPRHPDEGPRDYCQRIGKIRPDLTDSATRILTLYINERYAGNRSPDGHRSLARLVRKFQPARHPRLTPRG